jgi:hypothetical protein
MTLLNNFPIIALLPLIAALTAAPAHGQAVGPVEDRLTIPVQPAGNEIAAPVTDGRLMDYTNTDGAGAYASGEVARHAKEVELDSIRNSQKGLTGRPANKSSWLLTANNVMERIHSAANVTANKINEIRTAENRLKATINAFQDNFTGICTALKDFQISDLWDIRRKWSRHLDDQIFGFNYNVMLLESWLYNINQSHQAFTTAYKNLFSVETITPVYVTKAKADFTKDEYWKSLDLAEQAAIRTLSVNRSVDSILNQRSSSVYTDVLGFIGTITLNQDVSAMPQMTTIELEIAKLGMSLKNENNNYNDYLAIKSMLDRKIINLDMYLSKIDQNEALLKAAELRLLNQHQTDQAIEESRMAVAFKNEVR